MTSQPQPVPGEVKSAGQYLRPLRDLAAYVLVGATAVFLFLAVVDLIGDGFGYRTQGSFGNFINLVTIGFPLAAVLLSLLVQPRHPKAQLIVVAAAVEYAVMALFGVFFGVLFGLINEADHNGARSALEGLLSRVAWLAVFGVAAFAVFQIWRNMFFTPRPKPQPGMYGQPQYNQPGTYPAQPGYGPPPGQPGPGYPPPPAPGYPPAPGQQGFAPATYGQPAPAWNQPAAQIPSPNAPTSAAPAGTSYPAPASAAPAGTTYPAPATHPAPADPTQVVPPEQPDDRTQKLGDERPGFGPAGEDPPRQ
ncbi:hypothetical protein [Actinoplanes subtropicus]|uniref:hypothetical protein n=1 Tax=Actinoplanes subtropicus TaxID=543632 RepID=UPI0006907BB3|nr:hypothetical protein [Actinoplanes subtropicus]